MRLLYLLDKPIQNNLPYRLMAKEKAIQSIVLYIQSGSAAGSVEAINESVTKVELGNDYDYTFLPNAFFNKLFCLIQNVFQSDVVVAYGYFNPWQKLGILLSKLFFKKLVLTSDATYLQGTFESKGWKLRLKPFIQKIIYNHISNGLWVPSTASLQYHQSIGIQLNQMAITPYVVDEELISRVHAATRVDAFRMENAIPTNAFVFVFCAKFIERKRPLDVIAAFAQVANLGKETYLIMIGDGPLRKEMEETVNNLSIKDKVLFPGLIPYASLPEWYTAADILLFSSEHEPYGLPVNEAMLCGIPVIVSDRIGARLDLVEEGITGWIYPVGDVNALASCMDDAISHPAQVKQMGKAAQAKMHNWSSVANVEAQINFFRKKSWLH
ncbi:MAG: glycosyltransferase family 4 protein [Chitinophagaceae bacterium]|nr:glycosyltransferase family 4 protein [Chitinophagaceae bacterium]